jgi:hypothetical protein
VSALLNTTMSPNCHGDDAMLASSGCTSDLPATTRVLGPADRRRYELTDARRCPVRCHHEPCGEH